MIPQNPIGKQVGKYKIIRKLGQGAFGSVYLAQFENTKMLYAMKCIFLERFQECNGLIGKLVQNEKNALMKMDSNNVIKLYEYIESKTQAYLIMEYCNSGDFRKFYNQRKHSMTLDDKLNYFKQIINGMAEFHKFRLIHRDLKPENIFLADNVLKIGDLGFCYFLQQNQSGIKGNLGTVGYKAPEIIMGQKYNMQADIFSCGVILYEMIEGEQPFQAFNDASFIYNLTKNYPPKFKTNIPEDLKELICNMLQLRQSDRLKWSELYEYFIKKEQDSLIKQMSVLDLQSNIKSAMLQEQYKEWEEKNIEVEPDENDQILEDPIDINLEQQKVEEEQILNNEILENLMNSTYISYKNKLSFICKMKWLFCKQKFKHVKYQIFPQFLFMKYVDDRHSFLRSIINEGQNYFQIEDFQYQKLIKSEIFQNFKELLLKEKDIIEYQIKDEQQKAAANWNNLCEANFIKMEWKSELYTQWREKESLICLNETITKNIEGLLEESIQTKYLQDKEQVLEFGLLIYFCKQLINGGNLKNADQILTDIKGLDYKTKQNKLEEQIQKK